jgi:hypothetical protein
MKLFLLLFMSSCSLLPNRPNDESMSQDKRREPSRSVKIYLCMRDFAEQGFDSDALVKICSTIHERRQ